MDSAGSVAGQYPLGATLHRGRRRADELGGPSVPAEPSARLEAEFSDRANLLAFLRSRPIRESARALGLSRRSIYRLLQGYWPNEPREILGVWMDYKSRASQPASSWFLRRVRPEGVVHHGRSSYTSLALGTRVGELVAVARSHGGLLAQTLEPPLERLVLVCLGHRSAS